MVRDRSSAWVVRQWCNWYGHSNRYFNSANWLTTGTIAEPVEIRRFRHTDTEALAQSRRLRTDSYLRHGLLTDAHLIDGIDCCPDDDKSIHVGMYTRSGQLVGTVRVIRGLPEQPIPVAKAPFHVFTGDRPHGEISRYAVAEGWNGLGLVAGAWRELFRISIDEGLVDLYAEVEGFLLDALLAAGLPFLMRGKPHHVYNTLNYPVQLRIDTLVADLLPRNPMLAAFLADGWRPRSMNYHPADLTLSEADMAAFHDWVNQQSRSFTGVASTSQRSSEVSGDGRHW